MSKLPAVIPTTDLTESEMGKVQKYVEDGLPGIAEVTDVKIHRMLDLYLTGSTYTQIASAVEVRKNVVLYLAHHSNWFELKRDYLTEVQEKIKNRVIDAKLRNKEFVLLLVQAYQKKIGTKLTRYLATNDDSHMNDVDLKEVAQLMKAIDMVNELDNEGKTPNGKAPAVGLNLGDGVVVEKTGENSVSITPKKNSVGDLLQQFADERREKEKEKTVARKVNDIAIEHGENDENK